MQGHTLCHSLQNHWLKVTVTRLTFSSWKEFSLMTLRFFSSGPLPCTTLLEARGIIGMLVSVLRSSIFPSMHLTASRLCGKAIAAEGRTSTRDLY